LPANANSVLFNIYDAIKDLGTGATPTRGDVSVIAFSNLTGTNIEQQTGEVEAMDDYGNPIGTLVLISYADIPLITPSSQQQILLYVKTTYNNFSFIKKMFVLFGSPLKIKLNARVPIPDGIDVAEQSATVYEIDPDFPNDESKISYPSVPTPVKWELTPVEKNVQTRPIYSTEDMVLTGGVFSNTHDGIATNVFIGPIYDPMVVGYTSSVDPIFEHHQLKASVFYNGLSAEDSKQMEMVPISDSSYFLMEFDDVKQRLWSDGIGYAKMIISHNPLISITPMAEDFVTCLNNKGKTIYTVPQGSSVYIITNDPQTEIIWGDVVETIDPYSGREILDTTNAQIAYGSAFVSLSQGNYTYIYFRVNKTLTDQKIIGLKYNPTDTINCFGISREEDYKYEIMVSGSLTTILNNTTVNLRGGGSFQNGMPPTVLIPFESLQMRVVDKRVNGLSVESPVIDGISINEFVVDVSFGGEPVPDGTKVAIEIVHLQNNIVKSVYASVETSLEIDPLINPLIRSYAHVKIQPIPKGFTFGSNIYLNCGYEAEGTTRNATLCLLISADAEDTQSDISLPYSRSIFSNSVAVFDTSNNSWDDKADLNYARGYLMAATVSNNIYAIGGINGSNVVNYAEEYNTSLNTWSIKSPMPTARAGGMIIADGSYIYVIGGLTYDSVNNTINISRKVERYDVATDSWIQLEDMPIISDDIFKNVSYGIAYGVAYLQDGIIYILCGVKDISEDGVYVSHNDRILYYDISGNTWNYSDVVSTNESHPYFRMTPFVFLQGDNIIVAGGAFQDSSGQLHYLTGSIAYDIVGDNVVENDYQFDNVIIPRYKIAACLSDNENVYIFGGSNIISPVLNTVEKIYIGGIGLGPNFYYQLKTSMPKAKNGCAVSSYILGNTYILCVGGIVSGKGNYFLNIKMEPYQDACILDGKHDLGIKITLLNDAGAKHAGSIAVGLKGYIQSIATGQQQEPIIPDHIEFQNNNVSIVDGEGVVFLSPRADDVLTQLLDSTPYEEGQLSLKYKIIIQCTILDDNYYGQNSVLLDELSPQNTLPNTQCCVSSMTNVSIASLSCGSIKENSFAIISEPVRQSDCAVVYAVSMKPSLSYIENLTSSPVDSSTALGLINDL
jgi:hypothetical protein